jgi:hypothetical protein
MHAATVDTPQYFVQGQPTVMLSVAPQLLLSLILVVLLLIGEDVVVLGRSMG